MKKLINLVAGPIAAALLCVASVSPSYAAGTTVFISANGNDGNPCTLTLPCRTIGQGIFTAQSGGTVSCLDAGPYTVTYTTSSLSYTLDCRGVVYNADNAFALSVQMSSSVVTFRHVIFDGSGGGGGGVAVQILGGKVVFEDCTFQNFTASPGQAVDFTPSVAAQLTITDSVFTNNGTGAGGAGIIIAPSGGITVGAVIERTQVTGGTYGIVASGNSGGTALVEVRYSTIAGNASDGIQADGTAGGLASVVLEHSASLRNGGNGIDAQGASAYVSLKDSTVDWNSTGLATSSGGTILSYQNNLIAGNLHPGVTPVSLSQQ
jgi:hypothetical protein